VKVASNDEGWVKRGDGARMETAETKGGGLREEDGGEWKGRGVRGGG